MPNLVLTGFMGTGKTTVGKKIAKELRMEFVDTDKEIEQVTGLAVSEIFSRYGEVRFRSEEQAAVRRLARGDNRVIATGGGIVLNQENMTHLRANGVVVCLAATPEVIYERVRQKKTRPLLATEDPEATIRKLLLEREQFYRVADGIVDTSGKSPEQVRDEVIAIFRSRTKQQEGRKDGES